MFIHFAQSIPKLLERGLTDRVNLITINYDKFSSWPTNELPKTYISSNIILYLGLIFNPDESNRLIDHGPSPEDEKAVKEFRELWGNKSETRRFKDGNILECTVWDSNTGIESRSLIISEMVLYLLNLHYGINESKGDIQYFAGQLNEFVTPPSFVPKKIFDRNINGFQPVMKAYDELVKQLLSLENIPLKITSVKSTSSALRYSSVFIPQPFCYQNHHQSNEDNEKYNGITKREDINSHYIEPIDIQIQFEVSLRWPNDLVAVQKMKLAFYIRISEQLKSQFPGITTTVVGNNQNKIISLDEYLEIFTTSGFAFRCRIYYEREIPMLERLIKDPDLTIQKREIYNDAMEIEKRTFVDLPLHNSQIQTLCNKYPSLSLTIRITKRWFMANLFEGQVDEGFIEVLCAFVYLESQPWARPATGFVGFFRTLELIVNWDWTNEPIIVDLEENIRNHRRHHNDDNDNDNDVDNNTNEIIEEIRKKFNHHKESMFVATTSGIIWGMEKPDKVVARRIKDLAKASIDFIDNSLTNDEVVEFKVNSFFFFFYYIRI